MVTGRFLNKQYMNRVTPMTQPLIVKEGTRCDQCMSCHHPNSEIYLSPFRHQVSGHTVVLCPDQFHICKPYVEREAHFYRKMPANIVKFTPAFCGEIQVNMEGTCGSALIRASTSSADGRKRCRLCADSGSFVCKSSSSAPQTSMGHIFRDAESGLLNEANPWSIECQMRVRQNYKHNATIKSRYIVLENIVHQFRYPCMLDLKMGTRQHGDGINEKKRLKFLRKCERSTSKKYGVRIGGMQFFDISSSMYHCVNKYYGRSLNVYAMRNLLLHFFKCSPGSDRCKALCNSVHQRLLQLHKAISQADGCRLFSSSLLIAYDGDPELVYANNVQKGHVEVCLVDFAHSTCEGMDDEVRYSGPDDGLLLGIRTLISIFAEAL